MNDPAGCIRDGQVVALHEAYRARGAPELSAFAVRPWEMKAFHLHDPHGNLLRLGRAPAQI